LTQSFRLAHFSDPHLGPLPRPRLRELAGKRALGYANWRRHRHEGHRPEVLADLVLHLKAQAPDHVALTGDLVNIALASEFGDALTWLGELGSPAWVSVVPGNHDAYVAGALNRALGAWSAYVAGDETPMGAEGKDWTFPFVRRRGPLGIVGVSSAVATGFFLATGFVGEEQIMRVREALRLLGREGRFRVVLIHHPPSSKATSWHKRLIDARAVRLAIEEAGAELVLHGHTHRSTVAWLGRRTRAVPVVGIASASATGPLVKEPAAYNLFCITGDPGRWRIALETYAVPSEEAPLVLARRIEALEPAPSR